MIGTEVVKSSGSFSILPDEVVRQIFSYTAQWRGQANVLVRGPVCKRFTHLINHSRDLKRKYLKLVLFGRLGHVMKAYIRSANNMVESYPNADLAELEECEEDEEEDDSCFRNITEHSVKKLITKSVDFEDGMFLFQAWSCLRPPQWYSVDFACPYGEFGPSRLGDTFVQTTFDDLIERADYDKESHCKALKIFLSDSNVRRLVLGSEGEDKQDIIMSMFTKGINEWVRSGDPIALAIFVQCGYIPRWGVQNAGFCTSVFDAQDNLVGVFVAEDDELGTHDALCDELAPFDLYPLIKNAAVDSLGRKNVFFGDESLLRISKAKLLKGDESVRQEWLVRCDLSCMVSMINEVFGRASPYSSDRSRFDSRAALDRKKCEAFLDTLPLCAVSCYYEKQDWHSMAKKMAEREGAEEGANGYSRSCTSGYMMEWYDKLIQQYQEPVCKKLCFMDRHVCRKKRRTQY